MDNNMATALISAGGSVLAAITALMLNYRGFPALDGRFSSLEARMTSFEARVDARFKNDDRAGSRCSSGEDQSRPVNACRSRSDKNWLITNNLHLPHPRVSAFICG
jgi:hypothetical protein